MKKLRWLITIFIPGFFAWSQNVYVNIPATGVSRLSDWMMGQSPNNFSQKNSQDIVIQDLKLTPAQLTITASWQKLSGSSNVFSVLNSGAKPLQYNPGLNVVSFIHLKNTTYTSSPYNSNNDVVAMISSNLGVTWDSTCIWNDTLHRPIIPQGGVYNPPGNSNINNAYIVGCGATSNSGTVSGNFYASKPLGTGNFNNSASTFSNAMQYFSNTAPFPSFGKHDLSNHSFCVTDDGKIRSASCVVADVNATTTAAYGLTGAMIIKGDFTSGAFTWSGTSFTPSVTLRSDGSTQMSNKPIMAWNNTGTVGYLVIIGSLQAATTCNKGWQPIVYKTTNSGISWTSVPGINFSTPTFSAILNNIKATSADSTLFIPDFNIKEGIDATVDANNDLHIFTSIVGAVSSHPDSLDYTFLFGTEGYHWPHISSAKTYLYDFIYKSTGWTYLTIDAIGTEIPGSMPSEPGYQINPWNAGLNGKKVASGARLQLSRNQVGTDILYSWAESDTNFMIKKWNIIPNVKAKIYNINWGSPFLLQKFNLTGVSSNQGVFNKATFHNAAPVMLSSSSPSSMYPTFNTTVPMTISNSNPYNSASHTTHWYSTVSLQQNYVGMESSLINDFSFNVYPNPAIDNITIDFNNNNNNNNNKVTSVEILDNTGRSVYFDHLYFSKKIIELKNLQSGLYFVKVKTINGQKVTKIIRE